MTQKIPRDVLGRYIGEQLRQARKRQRWTREQLIDRLGEDLSTQTIATYEKGTRRISVTRFVELCSVLDVRPGELLDQAARHVLTSAPPGGDSSLAVNVAALATTTVTCLRPLKKWAALRLEQHQSSAVRAVMHLDWPALEQLAHLTDMDTLQLVRVLRSLSD